MKTLECCGQTFTGVARWRHVYEAHSEGVSPRAPDPNQPFWSYVSGAEFKRSVLRGETLPGVG